jgi:hypothetical protein
MGAAFILVREVNLSVEDSNGVEPGDPRTSD